MRHASIRLLAVLVLALALPLGACGDKGSSGSGASGSAGSSGSDGASSPQELIDRMKKAGEAEDFGQIIPLILPEQRAAMTMLLGIFPTTMMMGMMEAMSGMAAAGGEEKESEVKGKIASMKKDWDALLAKYKIEMPEGEDAPNIMKMSTAKTADDRRAALAEFDSVLGHVDHAAFIKESMAFLKSHADKEDDTSMSDGAWKKFDMQDVEIKVDGDTAVVTAKDEEPVGLVKKNGRWYMDIATFE